MASVDLSGEPAEMGLLGSMDTSDSWTSPFARIKAAEASFDVDDTYIWMKDHRIHMLSLVGLYLTMVFLGPIFMRNKRPVSCQKAANLWNGMLAIFSIYLFYRMTPEFFHSLANTGFHGSYCTSGQYFKGEHGFWAWLFHISKLIELGDTMFLVAKKRPVLFLHWYHHIVVLLDSWFSYVDAGGLVRWGTWMNLAVHSAMYTYFTMAGVYGRLPRWVAKIVTGMQITQFVVGTSICTFVFYQVVVISNYQYCDVYVKAMSIHLLMYTTFLMLFCNFFYNAYLKRKEKKKE